ncbi:uncharacterized protein NEMAJ01_1503 [Nematocida major]|uniref:uncharacterized protein n=1 Tax=Nematocida major TaxID=1912982 RepID=UPI00200783B0|nr:uncharacterized protein NEMAJ01_1503 [Nematocida major]KAH9386607.1 hypothetical protein NEMAJ01_1503 [Nematocida major]
MDTQEYINAYMEGMADGRFAMADNFSMQPKNLELLSLLGLIVLFPVLLILGKFGYDFYVRRHRKRYISLQDFNRVEDSCLKEEEEASDEGVYSSRTIYIGPRPMNRMRIRGDNTKSRKYMWGVIAYFVIGLAFLVGYLLMIFFVYKRYYNSSNASMHQELDALLQKKALEHGGVILEEETLGRSSRSVSDEFQTLQLGKYSLEYKNVVLTKKGLFKIMNRGTGLHAPLETSYEILKILAAKLQSKEFSELIKSHPLYKR